MKFPYGISDFKQIITENYFYCDRTDKIPLLETSQSQLFIRPRRFGKSLLLSMLENYYDVAMADEFDNLFSHLAIGETPTPLKNAYYILKWDFSCVDTTGDIKEIKRSLYNHINSKIESFIINYQHYGFKIPNVKIDYDDALYSLESLLASVKTTERPIYLLIDEYDNFANTVMMGIQKEQTRYDALVHDEGVLRTLFKTVKSSTSHTGFDRVFITGVSPVVLSDITSGYNIAEDIFLEPELNDLCGFNEFEVFDVIKQLATDCELKKEQIDETCVLMKTYYNGYTFSEGVENAIYNPTLCLYFFKHFQKRCASPRKMLDANLAVDESKLAYISQIPMGRDLLVNMMDREHYVTVETISDRFGIREMMEEAGKDNAFLVSFLYFFGVLTLVGEDEGLNLRLKVPNLVMQSLYVERVQKMLLPDPRTRDDGKDAASMLYRKGDIAPLCDFVENRYFSVFKNRDYRWANELTLKTAFLTLLYNDIIYIMDSETETGRRYADLTMIIRPDKRHGKVFDVVIEFKFVSLKAGGHIDGKQSHSKTPHLTGEAAKALSNEAIYALPAIKAALDEGEKQVIAYGKTLETKYGNLRLKKFVVASLGFERVCFKQVD